MSTFRRLRHRVPTSVPRAATTLVFTSRAYRFGAIVYRLTSSSQPDARHGVQTRAARRPAVHEHVRTALSQLLSLFTQRVSAHSALTTCTAMQTPAATHSIALPQIPPHQMSVHLDQWKFCSRFSFDVANRIDEVVFKPY